MFRSLSETVCYVSYILYFQSRGGGRDNGGGRRDEGPRGGGGGRDDRFQSRKPYQTQDKNVSHWNLVLLFCSLGFRSQDRTKHMSFLYPPFCFTDLLFGNCVGHMLSCSWRPQEIIQTLTIS